MIFGWPKVKRTDRNVKVGKKICKNDNGSSKESRIYCTIDEISPRYRSYEIINIQGMSLDEKSFWKFTQSSSGLSIEELHEPYELYKIYSSKDEDEWFSFVREEDIGRCVGYGDRITELSFDCTDERINAIRNNLVINKNNVLGEYVTKQLLVKQHYSLEDPKTIKKFWNCHHLKEKLSLEDFLITSKVIAL